MVKMLQVPQPTLAAISALPHPYVPNVAPESLQFALGGPRDRDAQQLVQETMSREVTIKEAADALSVSKSHIHWMLNAGKWSRARASKRLVRGNGASINCFLAMGNDVLEKSNRGEKQNEKLY